MSNKITQKRWHIIRKAEIMDTKICYTFSSFGKASEVSVAYEDLYRNKESHNTDTLLSKIGIGIFGFFSLFSIVYRDDKDFDPAIWKVWLTLFIISVVAYFIARENLWKIKVKNNTYLFFFKNTPNKEAVDAFIEKLFESRDAYLRDTYFLEANKNMSYELQLQNMQWLRRMEAITKLEFDSRKKELDSVFHFEISKIGFN